MWRFMTVGKNCLIDLLFSNSPRIGRSAGQDFVNTSFVNWVVQSPRQSNIMVQETTEKSIKTGGDDLDDGLELDPDLLASSDFEDAASVIASDFDSEEQQDEVSEDEGPLVLEGEETEIAVDPVPEVKKRKAEDVESEGEQDEEAKKAEKKRRKKEKEKERRAKVCAYFTKTAKMDTHMRYYFREDKTLGLYHQRSPQLTSQPLTCPPFSSAPSENPSPHPLLLRLRKSLSRLLICWNHLHTPLLRLTQAMPSSLFNRGSLN